ncbi:Altered inheritance of mitochondria protein 6 [Coniochaeta hoffmannii]|uniref:Altered inheritance of mitochondria protein 6 n=1 Tax=Coniochaeta hoffmannii TaxID=91930 RepID=A0AA38RUT5_9PEZI|nr:Altered inheritance of mitochondria protein 6 [Coniochaeta hoffmannii]
MRASSLLAGIAALTGAVTAQGSSALQAILSQAGTGNYTYPTALTQGIIPKALHSHNDYWRPVPLYSALAAGAVSVEADVWLINDVLYVGHEPSALSQNRTLDSLYIQPLLSVLTSLNPQPPKAPFAVPGLKNGVYDTASSQTLYLWIDVKTDGASSWPRVVAALEPLRRAGYLTTVVNGSTVRAGQVTVIGTGNTPLNLVQPVQTRDYFWDAPIATLNTTYSNITKEVSPVASADFAAIFGEVRNRTFSEGQAELLKRQVGVAHSKGIAVRYWDLPGWPIGTRNAVWRTLWDAGVDLINVDDLQGAAAFWEGD